MLLWFAPLRCKRSFYSTHIHAYKMLSYMPACAGAHIWVVLYLYIYIYIYICCLAGCLHVSAWLLACLIDPISLSSYRHQPQVHIPSITFVPVLAVSGPSSARFPDYNLLIPSPPYTTMRNFLSDMLKPSASIRSTCMHSPFFLSSPSTRSKALGCSPKYNPFPYLLLATTTRTYHHLLEAIAPLSLFLPFKSSHREERNLGLAGVTLVAHNLLKLDTERWVRDL